MDTKRDIAEGLNRLASRNARTEVFAAKVLSVDEAAATCDVEATKGDEYFDVRLRAVLDGQDSGLILLPAVGSWVMVENIGKSDSEYYVAMYSDVSKATLKITTTTFQLSASGLKVESGGDNLGGILRDLVDQINLITVSTSGGPSGTPINAAAFETIKGRLNAILQ